MHFGLIVRKTNTDKIIFDIWDLMYCNTDDTTHRGRNFCHTSCGSFQKRAVSEKMSHQSDSSFHKRYHSHKCYSLNQIYTFKMKTLLIFQLKRPSKFVHHPHGITYIFFSSETFSGRSSDHIVQLQPDDGMTTWGRALGIPLCTLSKRSLKSLLVAEDALRCGDIRNSPQGAPPSLWLTDQLGKPVLSHNSPGPLCSLWSHGSPLIHSVAGCMELCQRRSLMLFSSAFLERDSDFFFPLLKIIICTLFYSAD